jgi:hypothetical protein
MMPLSRLASWRAECSSVDCFRAPVCSVEHARQCDQRLYSINCRPLFLAALHGIATLVPDSGGNRINRNVSDAKKLRPGGWWFLSEEESLFGRADTRDFAAGRSEYTYPGTVLAALRHDRALVQRCQRDAGDTARAARTRRPPIDRHVPAPWR